MQPHDEPEPLPSLELRRDLHALRDVEPSAGFEDRLGAALRAAERSREKGARTPPPRSRTIPWSTWAVLAQATLAFAFLLHYSLNDPQSEIERSEELTVQLPAAGELWVPLRIATHHHEEGPTLHVHAPRGVEVSTHPVLQGAARRTTCEDATCTHRFTLPPPPHADAHVRVGIRSPGTYEINVRHRTDEQSVRERFVVRASR